VTPAIWSVMPHTDAMRVVGAGTPLFEGKPDVALQPIDTQTWDHSASILVRYEVRHNGA
jgi:hypothetical protein